MAPMTMTREAWLLSAVDALKPLFEEHGHPVPAVRVSVGWPGGRGKKATTIGQCWATSASADGVAQVFISPVLTDRLKVLATLTHELVHAVDDCKSGHRGAFAKIARRVGLKGKMTCSEAGEELLAKFTTIVDELGEYPHAELRPGLSGVKKQGTRMLKIVCADCGYVARTTRQWLDTGLPTCPCGNEMEES